MEPILYIGLSQSFFAGILIATKKPFTLSNRMLSAWFFLIFLDFLIVLLDSSLIQLYSIKVMPFTYGPLLYLYTLYLTNRKITFNLRQLLHFVPFAAFFIISLVYLNKPVMEGTKGFLLTDRFISLRLVYGACFFISVTIYSVLTFILIHRYRIGMKSILSFSSRRYALQWLLGISITFYVGYVLMFIVGLVDILVSFMPFDPYEISFLGLTILAFLFGIFGVKQPSVFEELSILTDIEKTAPDPKYRRSGLKKEDIGRYIRVIENHMVNDKPYLNRELTIMDLSDALNIPRHFITEIINTRLGKNFYNLVNEYRVMEVKKRLADPACKHLTILSIAYDSGFNSKSSFNHIFKQMTGQTPSQYLNSQKLPNTHPPPV